MDDEGQGQSADDLQNVIVAQLNGQIKLGYSAKACDNDNGRLFYLNHGNQTSSWLPPLESWDSGGQHLPYGWEAAVDKDGKPYYINHVNKTTTYEDPHNEEVDEVPQPREVELVRDAEKGFGFVAGSEKPVIVRFVTEGGPSIDKLLPGDQILKINGQDVKKAPRDHVIELVRSCKESVNLVVCQPYTENSSARKSALLSAAKKAKLKVNPSRVRFAEGVVISESPLYSPSDESCIPFMPNVLKVFLENGQTKSFKYDNSTTVQDVLTSLQEKLSIKCIEHFSLMVEHIRSLRRNKLQILNPKETLARIAARPGAQHLRCLFRVTFVPRDAYELLRKDPVAFEYLYVQCCNDVVQEKFAPELKYDIALRLAAFQIQQHGLSSNIPGKLSIKAIERETGLERFVPVTLVETMKRKELRKVLSHFLKINQNLSAPGHKHLTALQAKLHYLKIISELPSYGAKCFSTNLRDSNSETVILVSPKFGISQISGLRNGVPLVLAQLEELSCVSICCEDEHSRLVEIRLRDPTREPIIFSLEDRDASELALILQGYYRLLQNKELPVDQEKDKYDTDCAPVYYGTHQVKKSPWSYIGSANLKPEDSFKAIDLTITPPRYQPSDKPPHYIHQDGRSVKTDSSVNSSSVGANNPAANMEVENTSNARNNVDDNMNKMQQRVLSSPRLLRSKMNNNISSTPVETYDNVRSQSSPLLKRNVNANKNVTSLDFSSIVPFEVLEAVGSTNDENGVFEAKNEEVIKRVSEMEALVQDAESYLTTMEISPSGDECSKSTDTPKSSDSLESEGTLKPADSLTLLTQDLENEEMSLRQVIKKMGNQNGAEAEPSESDTDSHSTPSDSPSRRNRPKSDRDGDKSQRNSSFGFHSPDNLIPIGIDTDDSEIQDLLHKIQISNEKDDSQLSLPFADGAIYLDPDIIDLTMIPPPITPDRENGQLMPSSTSSSVNAPPTPFADRSSLEAELQAMTEITNSLTSDVLLLGRNHKYHYIDDELDDITNQISGTKRFRDIDNNSIDEESDYSSIASSSFDDSLSISAITTSLAKLQMENAAKYSLGNADDLESFIASMTIPPPPGNFESDEVDEPAGVPPTPESFELLSQDDIKAFIIPPPPGCIIDDDKDSDNADDFSSKKKSAAELLFPNGKLPVSHHAGKQSYLQQPKKKTLSLNTVRSRLSGQADAMSPSSPSDSSSVRSPNNVLAQVDNVKSLYKSLNDENSPLYAGFADAANIAETIPQLSNTWKPINGDSKHEDKPSANQKPEIPPKNVEAINSVSAIRQKFGQPVGGKPRRHSSGSESSDSGKTSPVRGSGIPRSNTSPSMKHKSANGGYPILPPKPNSILGDGTTSRQKAGSALVPRSPQKQSKLESPKSLRTTQKPPLPPASHKINGSSSNLRTPSPIKRSNGSSNDKSNNTSAPHKSSLNNRNGSINEKVSALNKVTVPNAGKNTSFEKSAKSNGDVSPTSKLPIPKDVADQKPKLNGNLQVLPLKMSSPKVSHATTNGTSDDPMEIEIGIVFHKAGEDIALMIMNLDETLSSSPTGREPKQPIDDVDMAKYVAAKDTLAMESRLFVTASKLFVKSVSESREKMVEHLTLCVKLLERIFEVSEMIAHTSWYHVGAQLLTVDQMQALVSRVKEVAFTFMQTVEAASDVVCKGSSNVTTVNLLMQQATSLATVLTSFMRYLKTHNNLNS